MVQNIGTVVTQIANGIVTIVRIVEGANAQAWKTVQVQHFLEVSDFIGRQVEHT